MDIRKLNERIKQFFNEEQINELSSELKARYKAGREQQQQDLKQQQQDLKAKLYKINQKVVHLNSIVFADFAKHDYSNESVDYVFLNLDEYSDKFSITIDSDKYKVDDYIINFKGLPKYTKVLKINTNHIFDLEKNIKYIPECETLIYSKFRTGYITIPSEFNRLNFKNLTLGVDNTFKNDIVVETKLNNHINTLTLEGIAEIDLSQFDFDFLVCPSISSWGLKNIPYNFKSLKINRNCLSVDLINNVIKHNIHVIIYNPYGEFKQQDRECVSDFYNDLQLKPNDKRLKYLTIDNSDYMPIYSEQFNKWFIDEQAVKDEIERIEQERIEKERKALARKNKKNTPKTYEWSIDELELSEGGFKSAKAAYNDAKKYLKSEFKAQIGPLEDNEFSVFIPGDSREGFLEFDGYGEIIEEDEDEDE